MTNDQLLNVGLAVGSVILTIIGSLLLWIAHGFVERLKAVEAALAAQINENLKIRSELATAVQECRTEVLDRQAAVNVDLFTRINTISENAVEQERECAARISDLSVSVAGLQGQYVTKREYDDDRRTRRS